MATNPENTSTNASSRGLQVVPKNRKGDLARWIDRGLAFRADPSSTLVISGFWRSGTTWIEESLREILHAKTLFEPLCPFAEDAKKIIAHGGVEHQSIEFLRMYMPYCGGENLNGHPLYKLYHRALCSTSGGSWVRRFRKGIGESFRSRHVIKFVRAQLCLRAAQNTFGMPVLHIWRDPRAVIASIKKTRWHWLFDHLKVQEQLLDRDDGRTEYFGRWRNEILEFDRSDAVARIAAYWALTEKYVRDCYTDDPKNFVCVSFETIVREREQEVAKILGRLELRPARADFKVSDRDSTTTSKPQRGTSVDERVAGWRSYLSETEIAEIESVIQYFGLSDRLDDDRAKMQADVDPAIVD